MADPKPVFEKIVECCERLFDARTFGVAIVGDDGQLSMEVIRMTASARAEIGADKADAIVARTLAAFPRPLAGTLTEKAIRKGDLVEIRDLQNDPDRLQPAALAAAEIGLGTSVVVAPLMWQGRGIGSLTMFRRDSRGLQRQGERAPQVVRRPGGDRDPERAPVQRDAGGAGAADRHGRDPAR